MTNIITIDGASGTGKTTICLELANILGYELLLSGLLYRLVALHALPNNITSFIANISAGSIKMLSDSGSPEIIFNGVACYSQLMQPEIAEKASIIAAMPEVRAALLPIQRAFNSKDSGLIAEGRDMGSVVFPAARLKVYLTASNYTRATRRAKQLQLSGKNINIDELLANMSKRDARDSNRATCPLQLPKDAIVIDTSELTIDKVVQKIITLNVV